MKKSVILIICVIYVLAIVIVGFLGLALKVGNEKIPVEEIICINEEYIPNNDKVDDNDYDGTIVVNYKVGLIINLNCEVRPDNADMKRLEYIGDEDSSIYTIEMQNDGSANIIFHKGGIAFIIVQATDNEKKTLKIKINAFDINSII